MKKEAIGREESKERIENEDGMTEKEEKGEPEDAPSHLPFAPASSEILDDSTTVDPSYIISLIRKLLPHQLNDSNQNFEQDKNGDNEEKSETKDPWEESGCILWDLAAIKTQAEFMVNNFILEVLLANLQSSESFRIKEICLGIIGNLACHDTIIRKISSQNDLIQTIIQQLFLDDSPCLTETFRVLEAGIRSKEYSSWAESLLQDEILERVLWILKNTLNPSLFEKCVDFLLAIIGNEQKENILRQNLIKLGLNNIAVNLLVSEIEKSSDDLDIIINLVEALSSIDGFAKDIESSAKLVEYFCNILKLYDKFEVSSYYASAILIIANILTEEKNLLSTLLHDVSFLEGLFGALPLLSTDHEAKNALWCIISTLLVEINENKIDILSLDQLARVLLSKTEIIEEYVTDHVQANMEDDSVRENYLKLYGLKGSMRRIGEIIEKWTGEKSARDDRDEIERVDRLLNCCLRCSGL